MFLLIIPILLVSGCIECETFLGYPKCPEPESTDNGLVFKDVKILPGNDIYDDTTITITGRIVNEEVGEDIEGVKLTLVDWCQDIFDLGTYIVSTTNGKQKSEFKPVSPTIEYFEYEEQDVYTKTKNYIPKLGSYYFSFTLKPKNKELIVIKAPEECRIKLKLEYEFNAYTSFYVPVLSKNEYNRRKKGSEFSKKSLKYEQTKGPVKIYVNSLSLLPIESGSDLILSFVVKNIKSGTMFPDSVCVSNEYTKNYNDEIYFSGLKINCMKMKPKFNKACDALIGVGEFCIQKKQTFPIKYILKHDDDLKDAPEKIYKLEVSIENYKYEVRHEEMIKIKSLKKHN